MVRLSNVPPPPPMPDVGAALLNLDDAKKALEREMWNRSQVEDVIRSAEHFIALAKQSLDKTDKKET